MYAVPPDDNAGCAQAADEDRMKAQAELAVVQRRLAAVEAQLAEQTQRAQQALESAASLSAQLWDRDRTAGAVLEQTRKNAAEAAEVRPVGACSFWR
jgi:hypothetical protein